MADITYASIAAAMLLLYASAIPYVTIPIYLSAIVVSIYLLLPCNNNRPTDRNVGDVGKDDDDDTKEETDAMKQHWMQPIAQWMMTMAWNILVSNWKNFNDDNNDDAFYFINH